MARLNHNWRGAAAAALLSAAWALGGPLAQAQEPAPLDAAIADDGEMSQAIVGSAATPMMTEPMVYAGAPAMVGSYGSSGSGFSDGSGVRSSQPINWISGPYLKSGVAMLLGEDILENGDGGWTISGGFRQPLMPAMDERLFFDFGGSYLSAYGATTRDTAGTITTTINGLVVNTTTDPDLFSTTLKEMKRGSLHAALGWYWGDPLDVRSNDPQLRIATRLGGRYGHMRGRFSDVASETPDANETFDTTYGKTDTFGGLFVGAEAILLMRQTRAGSVAWTLDGEFANDWVQFGGFGGGSLGTASVMLGVMLSR
ncbi:MAG TPA: hypothetical protein VEQ85_01040 [Lacipirellulaceae bacterium]|nr:hypothetical protein [Lacipirellulaceae bacterium]